MQNNQMNKTKTVGTNPTQRKPVRRSAKQIKTSAVKLTANMQQTYSERTPVDAIIDAFAKVIREMAGRSTKMHLVCNQSTAEFSYMIVHENACLTMQVYEMETVEVDSEFKIIDKP
jgi:hypothetical protein